jgi:hypothetical protein
MTKPGSVRQCIYTALISVTRDCKRKLLACQDKGKAISLKALTGPEGSRRLRLPHFKTVGT